MAVNEPDRGAELVERATAAMREDEPSGWIEVSRDVRRRARDVVRPAPAVVTVGEDGRVYRDDHGSRFFVSTRIVRHAIRTRTETPDRAVDGVRIDVAERRCERIVIDLICRYGIDLLAEGEVVRATVAATVAELIGPDPLFDVERDIVVSVIDIVDGDPRCT